MHNMWCRLILIVTLYIVNNIASADASNNSAPNTEPTPMATTIGANPTQTPDQDNQLMEKCHVVDSNGNGLIKPYMADSGVNLDGDASAWIWVPYGQCSKINNGDFSGVSQQIRQKIETSNIQNAPTLE